MGIEEELIPAWQPLKRELNTETEAQSAKEKTGPVMPSVDSKCACVPSTTTEQPWMPIKPPQREEEREEDSRVSELRETREAAFVYDEVREEKEDVEFWEIKMNPPPIKEVAVLEQ